MHSKHMLHARNSCMPAGWMRKESAGPHWNSSGRTDGKMAQEKLVDVLVRLGLAENIKEARALVMAGEVYQNELRLDRPAQNIKNDSGIHLRNRHLRYVSRGGLKLEKAMQTFPIDLKGRYCMDIGASTGGFTDCMLQNGAAGVYAIDVGYGQLDWKLREDPRVVCMEKTNFRYVTPDDLDPERMPDFASVDVSAGSSIVLWEED